MFTSRTLTEERYHVVYVHVYKYNNLISCTKYTISKGDKKLGSRL